MDSSKFLHLRWNDYEANVKSGFSELRKEEELFDITLAAGSQQIKAHKVILSACSPFFRSLIKSVPHQHPLLYLRGIQPCHLESLLCFIYNGEVSVSQESLNGFLSVAEELQVKGLTQSSRTKSPEDIPLIKKKSSKTLQKKGRFSEIKDALDSNERDNILEFNDSIDLDSSEYETEAFDEECKSDMVFDTIFLRASGCRDTSESPHHHSSEECPNDVMILSDESQPKPYEIWSPVRKKGMRNVMMWPMFDISGDRTLYRCMACRKRFKVTSSPSSVARHLLICRRGAFYKTEDKLSYAAAASRGDFMSEQNFDF
eukprot:TRINITY_DN7944_c0_g1_i2.p1 TRINITY_DN7944_c0_g1~~TRINITY_DN7944_c0_g1_i2.p1  ORF type:complete len:315 (+),score=67.91 TRINITY_DN7944_c0_g1_i2:121-1065(+)